MYIDSENVYRILKMYNHRIRKMYIGFSKCIQDSENVYRILKMYIDSENVYRIRKMYIGFGKCI